LLGGVGDKPISNTSLTTSVFYNSTLIYNFTQVSYRKMFVLEVLKFTFLPLYSPKGMQFRV